MSLPVFQLESYFEPREHSAAYLLSSSDLESFPQRELLEGADAECRGLWENLTLGYTESRGLPRLRSEIAENYPSLDLKDILVCSGAQEAMTCAFHGLLTPGDHAITVVPCYQSLRDIPKSLCETTEIPLNEADGWSLDLDALKKAVRPNTKLIVVNFPHNPTGALLPRESFDALVAIARNQGAYLFFDEVYRLLELDPNDRLPPVASVYEKGISLGVLSKAYGLAGLRIGWLACRDKTLIERSLEQKYYLTICSSAPSEILSLTALRQSEKILSRNHALLSENLAVLEPFLDKHADMLSWTRPKGGCTGFARFADGIDAERIAEELLKAEGVMILPGSVYDRPGPHFRLSYGRRTMPEALTRFGRFLKKY